MRTLTAKVPLSGRVPDLVAVDPGLHQCGMAVWKDDRLIWAELVKNPDSIPGQGALCAHGMAWAIHAVMDGLDMGTDTPLVIEVPQVYNRGRGGDPNDLIDLSCVVGGVLAVFGGAQTVYRPAQWKGQVPKEVTTERAKSILSPGEVSLVASTCPASLAHNVWDAVALGLAHKRKVGVLR